MCPAASVRAVSDRVVAKAFAGFQALDGVAHVALADISAPWPRTPESPAAGAAAEAGAELEAELLEAELTLSLEVQDPVAGLRLPAADVPMARASCGAGRSLGVATGRCRTCERGQYVLDPDADPCRDCPVGAACNGSAATGLVAGSDWVQVGRVVRLARCPPGHILVRDEAAPGLDQCVMCPPGTHLPPSLERPRASTEPLTGVMCPPGPHSPPPPHPTPAHSARHGPGPARHAPLPRPLSFP